MSSRWIAACFALCLGLSAWAQTDGTYSGYSPYSVYGVGNLHHDGAAWQNQMGGVGIATRNKRFVNIENPASVTARDSLSFMADIGLGARFSFYSQNASRGVSTVVNIDNFVISFPMWRHTAMMVGIKPYSDMGYKVSYSMYGDSNTGTRTFTSAGNGGIYEVFAGAAVTLWNRLSLGVQYSYLFGGMNKETSMTFNDASFHGTSAGDSLQVRAHTATFGLQYEQPLSSKHFLTVGATYRLAAPVKGYAISFDFDGVQEDRTENKLDKNVLLGSEIGAGLAFRETDRWSVEVDYCLKDWRRSNLDAVRGFANRSESAQFAASMGHTIRAGFEITPARNDIRYFFRRCTYRGGLYYEQSYYKVNGKSVDAAGLTFGMTMPVFRGYNGLSIGMELGQRGLAGEQVKERYIGVNIGFNVFDIWFQKPRYE